MAIITEDYQEEESPLLTALKNFKGCIPKIEDEGEEWVGFGKTTEESQQNALEWRHECLRNKELKPRIVGPRQKLPR